MEELLRAIADRLFRPVLDSGDTPALRHVTFQSDQYADEWIFTAQFENLRRTHVRVPDSDFRDVRVRMGWRPGTDEEVILWLGEQYRLMVRNVTRERERRAAMAPVEAAERAGLPGHVIEELRHRVLYAEHTQMEAAAREDIYRLMAVPPVSAGVDAAACRPMTATEVQARQREGHLRMQQGIQANHRYLENMADMLIRQYGGYIARPERNSPADVKARALLISHLSETQRLDFAEKEAFNAIGSEGGRYRIEWGTSMNIVDQKKGGRICFHPKSVAVGDAVLAQKVMLECDEAGALKIANRNGGGPGPGMAAGMLNWVHDVILGR